MPKLKLRNWACAVLEDKDIHFDQLDEPLINGKMGKELLQGSCELILNLHEYFKNVSIEKNQYVLITHCLEHEFKKLPKWKDSYWDLIGQHRTPPNLFFFDGRIGFNHRTEFYSIGLTLPFEEEYPLDCFFRVDQCPEDYDFTADICLVSRVPLGPKKK